MHTLLLEESPEIPVLLLCISVLFYEERLAWYACVSVLLMMGYFYRCPERVLGDDVTQNPAWVMAPTDGAVLRIEELPTHHKITVYLSILDVHVQWYPVSGTVRRVDHIPGEFNLAHILEKSDFNERVITEIEPGHGDGGEGGNNVIIEQIAGQVARRIVNDSVVSSRVERGNRMGMIKLSSRVNIYLPRECTAEVYVKPGDVIVGNETVIARFTSTK